MTAKELNELKGLNREIRWLKQRLSALDDFRENPLGPKASHLPVEALDIQGTEKGPPPPPAPIPSAAFFGENQRRDMGSGPLQEPFGLYRRYCSYRNKLYIQLLETLCRRCEKRRELSAFIQDIPQSELRQIFYLRYYDSCSWDQVAARMGSHYTRDSVRMRHDRYLKNLG